MGRKAKNKDSSIPQTELKLQELQSLYVQDKNNKKVSDEFFLLIRAYGRSIALKEISRLGRYFPPERIDEICTDITLRFLKYYNKDNFLIRGSFGGYLYQVTREVMYGSKLEDQHSSLNLTLSDDKDSKELIEIVSSSSPLPWSAFTEGVNEDSDNPEIRLTKEVNVSYSEVESVIDDAYDILPYRVFMRFLPWLVLQFRKPKTHNVQQLFTSTFLTSKEENSFDILLLEVYKRISQHVL